MTRNNLSLQDRRSSKNPFPLGTFRDTSLRYIKGKLGPKNEVISGGYGGGEYNHWYQITLDSPGWIIAIKDGQRAKYINVSAYDLNKQPIQGRSIFDKDSVVTTVNNEHFYPYTNTVMGAQSDIANTFDNIRLDKGDERYFPLEAGSYLLCVSATRNEPIDYALGLVIEFPVDFGLFLLEDGDGSVLFTENLLILDNTVIIESPVTVNFAIPVDNNAFTILICEINSGVTVTVPEGSTWFIGTPDSINTLTFPSVFFELEAGHPTYFDTVHDHSLSEWRTAWQRDHHSDDRFPEVFIPYATEG